jgi:branched-chain amino acid transport system substrate-binding protein
VNRRERSAARVAGRRWHSLAAVVATVALAGTVAACGGNADTDASSSTGTDTLTIYSSMPLRGKDGKAARATSIVNGEKLALAQSGGKAGDYEVKFVSLDSEKKPGEKDPAAIAAAVGDNARRAVQDGTTIAYLGDLEDRGSAVSIPILNQANILQISPTNTYVGLTRVQNAEPGEPDKYYPSGRRTYGRIIPADHIQAGAQAAYQTDEGCTSTYIVHGQDVYGSGIATAVAAELAKADVTVAGNDEIDPGDSNYRSLANKIKGSGANCVFFGGTPSDSAVQLWKDIHAADPTVKLFGPAKLAEPEFVSKIGTAGEVTFFTTPALAPKDYPASGQKFFSDYRKAYGTDPGPDAIFGYEAMQAALLSIKNAGKNGNNRAAVVKGFFDIKDRDSVLGTYSIDHRGDTTLSNYGGQRVQNGKLVFDRVIDASNH